MIRIDGLTKRYGHHVAVDDVTFSVGKNKVVGFLGPNGAGKSTTLRMLVGLTPASAGSSTVLGVPYTQLGNPGRSVGVLLDASAQHAGRTGREALQMGAMLMGLPSSRADEMIEMVGLSPIEAKRRMGGYSLGMRQRLGIAHALLGNPKILILDEPANGLDPAGIRWMRDLLRYFADNGGSVLLSSHLLHEIEAIADELVVIGNGRIVAQGTKAELLNGRGTLIRTVDNDALARHAKQANLSVTKRTDGALLVEGDAERVSVLAFEAGLRVTELRPDAGGLEDMFLTLTEQSSRDRAPERTEVSL